MNEVEMYELVNRIRSRHQSEINRVLRHVLPYVADEVVAELERDIPGFADLLEETDREKVRHGVQHALMTAIGEEADETAAVERHPAVAADTPPPGSTPLKASAERARRELFEVLAAGSPGSGTPLAELARMAGWPLPQTVQAVALVTPGEAPQLSALGDILVGAVGDELCLLIPDPERLAAGEAQFISERPGEREVEGDTPAAAAPMESAGRAVLDAALRGRAAAVGHVVPLNDAASSVRWARRLLAMTPTRSGPEARAVFVDDHLSGLLLLQDESLMRALASRWLKPLAALTPRQSERLEMTLLAWLEGGGAPEAAKALKVHPQTVRYRLRQIEKLFGPGLRDPRTRFELEMALRSRRLAAQVERARRQYSRMVGRPRGARVGLRPLGIAREARVNGL
ncbi:PucR family transcriptional regulator [Streptomyces sp. NPDC006879]|uniref:PucR family transcriptional regulator n=1 Tax=Streptomyces sp. NPDC006879 TaxID=3364767 RepID=UPI0036955FA3